MELRRAVLHGLLHVQHERQLFILHLNGPHGLHRRDFALRDDPRRHRRRNSARCQFSGYRSAVLMVRVHRSRWPAVGERTIRRVKARQIFTTPGICSGRRRVHGLDKSRVQSSNVSRGRSERRSGPGHRSIFCPPGRLVKKASTRISLLPVIAIAAQPPYVSQMPENAADVRFPL